jgi:RNA polymerase sigma factor (sigma-70 family)
MTPGSEVTTRLLMEQVAMTVRAALRRKSGLSLADDDLRAGNIDALDICQDTLVRVWERVGAAASGSDADVADLKAYATTVAHNLWSDYLRRKYPRRTSLKNRLRYFFSHASGYALWDGPDHSLECGRAAWRYGTSRVDPGRLQKVSTDLSWAPAQAKPMERFSAADWSRFLDAFLGRAGGPVQLDDLVSITASVLEIREDRMQSTDTDETGERALRELPDGAVRTPEADAELRGSIGRLWTAVKALRPDYRCVYLLNIPGPGKSRGDIEVFVDSGVARVTEIGQLLGLTEDQYAIAWDALPLSADEWRDIERLRTQEERFCLLWKYLPLADALIARLLGLQPQQVINRRTIALRELSRTMSRAGL